MPELSSDARIGDVDVLASRGARNSVDPHRPYAFLAETERSSSGAPETALTIFLTNRECPFRCIYCDLWKNTTRESVSPGNILEQIDYALAQLPSAKTLKLYNSGNFFDRRAIPAEDYEGIIARSSSFSRLVVENHPRLCGQPAIDFGLALFSRGVELEIAMGLETVHPQILPRLNKRMTAEDFQCAAANLLKNRIAVRAFVLLMPPFMPPHEAVDWAVESVRFAVTSGSRFVAIIPTRGGNGLMEELARERLFAPPTLEMLEKSLAHSLALGVVKERSATVTGDLWDVEKLFTCQRCGPARAERLRQINFQQQLLPEIQCECADQPRAT